MTRSASPRSRLGSLRARVRALPGGHLAWRVGVTVAGAVVIALGIVLLPLPGPGWLVIFAGMGLLATEYEWAARLLRWGRKRVTRWTRWAASRARWLRLLMGALGVLFVGGIALASWFVAW